MVTEVTVPTYTHWNKITTLLLKQKADQLKTRSRTEKDRGSGGGVWGGTVGDRFSHVL